MGVEIYIHGPSLGHPAVPVEGRQSMPILIDELLGKIQVATQMVELGGVRQVFLQTHRLDSSNGFSQVDLGRSDESVDRGQHPELRSVPRVNTVPYKFLR